MKTTIDTSNLRLERSWNTRKRPGRAVARGATVWEHLLSGDFCLGRATATTTADEEPCWFATARDPVGGIVSARRFKRLRPAVAYLMAYGARVRAVKAQADTLGVSAGEMARALRRYERRPDPLGCVEAWLEELAYEAHAERAS